MIPEVNYSMSDVMEANFTLNESYSVVMGDERFYRLMGDKTLYTFNMLAHPDDRQQFENFMNIDSIDDYTVIRIIVGDNTYRWFILSKKGTACSSDDKTIFNLQMQDIFVLTG